MILILSLVASFACLLAGFSVHPLYCTGSIWFCLNLLFWLFLLVITLPVPGRKNRLVPSPFYYGVMQLGFRWLLAAGFIHYRFHGFDQIPQNRKCLIVCNHASNFDSFILSLGMTSARKTVFISKPENFRIPIAGSLMKKCAYISITRGNPRLALQAILKAISVVESDIAHVGVFPEGTRSSTTVMAPFKPGAFKIATKTGCPIIVMGLRYHQSTRRCPWLPVTVDCSVLEVVDQTSRPTPELADYCHAVIQNYISQER